MNLYPLLPLRDIVVFPGQVVPLFVGREKSVAALEEAMAGSRDIFLLAQLDPGCDDPDREDLYDIGVVAQVPNFNKLLKKNDVDYKEYTAGQYKRTVSVLGEITPQGEQKFIQQLEDTHVLFKNFVAENRPQVDLNTVATGEYWYGTQALQLRLVDEIKTSDDWLMERLESHDIFHLKYEKKLPLREKLSGILGQALQNAFQKSLEKLEERKFL